jgi:hypothetical protein
MTMKPTILLLALVFFFTQHSLAQKSDRYCEVQCTDRSWRREGKGLWAISLMTSQADSIFGWKDSSVLVQLSRVTSFQNPVDVLNYMGSIGWTLTATTSTAGPVHFFYFKKSFNPAELKSN